MSEPNTTKPPSVTLLCEVTVLLITLLLFIFSAAASLFPEFLGSFLKNSSSAVFELLEDYQSLCQDKVGRVCVCVCVFLT